MTKGFGVIPGALIFLFVNYTHSENYCFCSIIIPGGINMTIFDMKRLDRRLREISDMLGIGFPIVKKVIAETAEKYEMPVSEMLQEYIAWKWKK